MENAIFFSIEDILRTFQRHSHFSQQGRTHTPNETERYSHKVPPCADLPELSSESGTPHIGRHFNELFLAKNKSITRPSIAKEMPSHTRVLNDKTFIRQSLHVVAVLSLHAGSGRDHFISHHASCVCVCIGRGSSPKRARPHSPTCKRRVSVCACVCLCVLLRLAAHRPNDTRRTRLLPRMSAPRHAYTHSARRVNYAFYFNESCARTQAPQIDSIRTGANETKT